MKTYICIPFHLFFQFSEVPKKNWNILNAMINGYNIHKILCKYI